MDESTRDVLLTLITVSGTVISGFFASRSKRHSRRASIAADAAVEASLKPPRMATRFGTNPRIELPEIESDPFPREGEGDESPPTPRDVSVDLYNRKRR